jgi:hypothetical protein
MAMLLAWANRAKSFSLGAGKIEKRKVKMALHWR